MKNFQFPISNFRLGQRQSAIGNRQFRGGFTLVELLVVIGILLLLAALLLPALHAARIQADRARTSGDLQVISIALESFKQDTGDYPRPSTASPDASWLLGTYLVGSMYDTMGNGLGYRLAVSTVWYLPSAWVVSPPAGYPASPLPGGGYQARPGGRIFGPYLQTQSVMASSDTITLNNSGLKLDLAGHLLDHNSVPIIYLPAHPTPQPDPMSALGFVSASGSSVWNYSNVPTTLPSPLTPAPPTPTLAQVEAMLGDRNLNGQIDAGETAAYTGPFILWSAGPDLMWGPKLPSNGTAYSAGAVSSCDDVLSYK